MFQADVVSPGRAHLLSPGRVFLDIRKGEIENADADTGEKVRMARAFAIGVSPALALSMPAPWFRYLMLRGDYSCSITCRQC